MLMLKSFKVHLVNQIMTTTRTLCATLCDNVARVAVSYWPNKPQLCAKKAVSLLPVTINSHSFNGTKL